MNKFCFRRLLLVCTLVVVGVVQAGIQDFLLWQVQSLPNSSELVYGSYVSGECCRIVHFKIKIGSAIKKQSSAAHQQIDATFHNWVLTSYLF